VHSGVQTFVEFMMCGLAHPVFRKVKSMIRKLIMATMLGGLLLGATACNTVKGAGDDLKSVSKTTEDAIN
jgi:entericidin B